MFSFFFFFFYADFNEIQTKNMSIENFFVLLKYDFVRFAFFFFFSFQNGDRNRLRLIFK